MPIKRLSKDSRFMHGLVLSAIWSFVDYGIFCSVFLTNPFSFRGRNPSRKNALLSIKTDASLKDYIYLVSTQFGSYGQSKKIFSGRVDRWITADGHVSPLPFTADMHSALTKISEKSD